MKNVSIAIRKEAAECEKSANDMRNTPEHRDIFHVVGIILTGIAENLEHSPTRQLYLASASAMDWQQVVLNGGPTCFHLLGTQGFCGRAERWAGHIDGADHKFVSLSDMLKKFTLV